MLSGFELFVQGNKWRFPTKEELLTKRWTIEPDPNEAGIDLLTSPDKLEDWSMPHPAIKLSIRVVEYGKRANEESMNNWARELGSTPFDLFFIRYDSGCECGAEFIGSSEHSRWCDAWLDLMNGEGKPEKLDE